MISLNEEQAYADPFTIPSWRWEAAKAISKNPKLATKCDDRFILEAVDHLAGRARFDALSTAEKVFADDGLVRAELEARILAKQPVADIAERMSLPEEVIDSYETIFFCVWQCFLGHDWRIKNTVGLARFDGFPDAYVRQFWALMALAVGPIAVDAFVEAYKRNCDSQELALSVYLKPHVDIPRSFQSVVAAHVIPLDVAGMKWLEEFNLQWMEIAAMREANARKDAIRKLHRSVIRRGRTVLAGKPLPLPPKPQLTRDQAELFVGQTRSGLLSGLTASIERTNVVASSTQLA